jgi:hypothetical protein
VDTGIERQLVEQILIKIQNADKRKFSFAKNRPENQETIKDLGYTDYLVEDEIMTLTVEECVGNFKADKGGYDGSIYEFGRVIKSKEVYIKFRAHFEDEICYISCISFHYPKYELRYRFR